MQRIFTLKALSLTVIFLGISLASVAAPRHKHHQIHHPNHVAAPMTWNAQMADFLRKCDPSITADQIGRVAAKAQEILARKGIDESQLSILSHVNASIPSGINVGTHPQDYFAAYVTLRIGG